MKKLPPGKSQMGHEPFSKVKLEGPKVRHDDHGKNASVPAKPGEKVPPNSHWEKQYKTAVGNQDKSGIRAFDPMRSKDRPCTHVKVNEQDH